MITIDIIRSNQAASDAADAGDWSACAAALNARTIEVRDSTPVTYAKLTATLGDQARQLVAGTLRAIATSNHPAAGEMQDAHMVLLNESGGLRIDTDERQVMLDQVAAVGNWPPELTTAIKAQGLRYESTASQAGLPDATPDECEAAIVSQQSLQYLTSKVAARDSERQQQLQPILDARTRDNELVRSLTDRIAVAQRDGQTLLVTQESIDVMLGGA